MRVLDGDRVPVGTLLVLLGDLLDVRGEVADIVLGLEPLLLGEGAAHEVLLERDAEAVGTVVALDGGETRDGL